MLTRGSCHQTGYPPTPSDAFVIAPGATYTMSYRAMATATTVAPTVEVKIGGAKAPYAVALASGLCVALAHPLAIGL